MKRLVRIIAAVLPAIGLLVLGELAVRIGAWADPELLSLPLPDEDKVLRADPELFWTLQPNLNIQRHGHRIQTNSLGLRGGEIETKQEGEIRVLSLGESTAFGQGVSNHQTYAALLEERLENEGDASERVRVINAGVPAYSSFQSLKYLELRGVDLEPDVVLLYHEVNDYLPSTLRGSEGSELGFSRTDAQLYDSQKNVARRILLGSSALLRFLDLRLARYRIERFQAANQVLSRDVIGLPEFGFLPRIIRVADDGRSVEKTGISERALPQRVSEAERRQNLEAFQRFCAARGIRLLVIHPSYRDSSRHECLLTEVYARLGVPVLDAYDVLHPPGSRQGKFFVDLFHPRPAGHRRLADAIEPHLLELLGPN